MNTETTKTLERFQRAVEMLDEMFPELETDCPEKRDALAWALAKYFANRPKS